MKSKEKQIPFIQTYSFELPDELYKLNTEGWRRWITQQYLVLMAEFSSGKKTLCG